MSVFGDLRNPERSDYQGKTLGQFWQNSGKLCLGAHRHNENCLATVFGASHVILSDF